MKNFRHVALSLLTAVLFIPDGSAVAREPVKKDSLGTHNGRTVYLFTLVNKNKNVLKITNYGARIVRIEVPDRNGARENVTLGSETFDGIIRGDMYGGAVVGRFANRIANGKITLDGTEYSLPVNNRPNTLHGGRNGWFSKVWDARIISNGKNPAVKLSYNSPDLEEGFPGNVVIEVIYTWTDKNEIVIDYTATTDKKTVINVTNHAYFNLRGAGNGYIFDHIMVLNSSYFTPFNNVKIPTGEIKSVKGTPFDFTLPMKIGEKIGETFENAVFDGYDHNFVLDNKKKVDAVVYEPESGRQMEVITSEPGMQFYSGSGMAWKRSLTSGTKPVNTRSGFALETQHYPDSPNQPQFPTTVLEPGKSFKSKTIYRFSVRSK